MAVVPRGIRSNNPGNIIQSSIQWQGKETPSRDPRFESFDTPLNGIRALCKLLISYQDKHNLNTVRGIINRWAPPVENNTSAYVYSVAAALGVSQDKPINTHDSHTLAQLATAIIQHENGQQPYPPELIAQAVRTAGGMPDTVGVSKPTVDVATPKLNKVNMDPISLVSILTSAFAPLIRAKVEKAVGSDVGKPLADNLLALAQSATGKTDPLEAVAVARQDPAIVAKIEAAAADWLAQVAPLLDKIDGYERAQQTANAASADAAGERGRKDAVDLAPQIVRYMFAIVAGALLFLFFVMGVQAWSLTTHEPTTAMLTLVGPLLGGIFGSLATIVAYRFGEKRNSSAAEASQAIAYKLAERP